jgi:polyisoprenoid-binding protein YceI
MKKVTLFGMAAMSFFFVSCGGSNDTETTTENDSTQVEVIESVVMNYSVDTANTVITWSSFEGTEVDHQGTVKALSGTAEITTTGDVQEITGASLIIDMNSINEESEKLVGHLKNEDFFNVNNYATTEFKFDRHEDGMIYGNLIIVGKELPVEAPATVVTEGNTVSVNVGDFKLDFSKLEMPFYIEDVKAPVEEQHDPMIGFSAVIKANAAE